MELARLVVMLTKPEVQLSTRSETLWAKWRLLVEYIDWAIEIVSMHFLHYMNWLAVGGLATFYMCIYYFVFEGRIEAKSASENAIVCRSQRSARG